MIEVAQILLFDRYGQLLIYLRDEKPKLPFPNHWDFFGGHLEPGETPEQALVRELQEELSYQLVQWQFFRTYLCLRGDVYPNRKFMFWSQIDEQAENLTLHEGQRMLGIAADQRHEFRFANILGDVLEDFVNAGLWPGVAAIG